MGFAPGHEALAAAYGEAQRPPRQACSTAIFPPVTPST